MDWAGLAFLLVSYKEHHSEQGLLFLLVILDSTG